MRSDNEQRKILVRNMQKHLKLVRQAAGWSVQELADLIGVSRQTIHNIENEKSPMSTTQYVALCAILDYRVKEKTGLDFVIKAVLNLEPETSTEEYSNVEKCEKNTYNDSYNKRYQERVVSSKGVASAAAGAVIGAGIAGPVGSVVGGFLGQWISKMKDI